MRAHTCTHLHACTHIHVHMYLHLHTHVPTRTHVHTCTHIHALTCVHTHVPTHIHVPTCAPVHVHTCVCTCTCTCPHMHAHTCVDMDSSGAACPAAGPPWLWPTFPASRMLLRPPGRSGPPLMATGPGHLSFPGWRSGCSRQGQASENQLFVQPEPRLPWQALCSRLRPSFKGQPARMRGGMWEQVVLSLGFSGPEWGVWASASEVAGPGDAGTQTSPLPPCSRRNGDGGFMEEARGVEGLGPGCPFHSQAPHGTRA